MTEWENLSRVRHIDPETGVLVSVDPPKPIQYRETRGMGKPPKTKLVRWRTKYEHVCKQCGKRFKTAERVRQFCSVKCSNDARTTTVRWKKCPICDTMFKPARAPQVTCSRECGLKWKHRQKQISLREEAA